jgi:hypothetical protein
LSVIGCRALLDDRHVRQLAVALIGVESVADDETIGHFEADVVDGDVDLAA